MNIFTKVSILLFPIIIFIVLRLIFNLLKIKNLKNFRINDVLLVFLIFGLNAFMKNATEVALFPYYVMLASGIALVLLLIDIFIYKEFVFEKFFRHFWRVLSLVTFVMYFCLIIAAFFF